MNYLKLMDNISVELKRYLDNNTSIESLIIGISGGIDSALCCALADYTIRKYKLDIKLIGRSIPISSNKSDEIERAHFVGNAFCDDFKEVEFDGLYMDTYWEFNDNLVDDDDNKSVHISKGNIKARLRMMYLYYLASKYNGLVLSTDNWTEYLLGFWTLHGDVGDLGMIQELWKTEVYELAEYISKKSTDFNSEQKTAIQYCIDANPTDGLGVSKSDLDQIMPGWENHFDNSRDGYKFVDLILQGKDDFQLPEHLHQSILNRHLQTKYKRNNPYNFKRKNIINGSSI